MCDLCILEKRTRWFTSRNGIGEVWTVIECESDHSPMAVYKNHEIAVPIKDVLRLLRGLRNMFPKASVRFQARKIQDHFHVHVEGEWQK